MISRSRYIAAVSVLFALFLTPVLAESPAHGAGVPCAGTETHIWNGSADSNYLNAANWSGGVGTSGTVCITASANNPIITTSVSLTRIRAEDNTSITIDSGGALTASASTSVINDLVIDNGGTLNNPSGFNVGGTFDFIDGTVGGPAGFGVQGLLNFSSPATKTINADFYVGGDTTWDDGNIDINSAFHNYGTFTSQAGFLTLSVAGLFENFGTIEATTVSAVDAATFLNHPGATLSADGGAWLFPNTTSFTNNGTIELVNSANLDLLTAVVQGDPAAVTTVDGSSTLSATTFDQSDGQTSIPDGTIQADYNLSGGTLTGSGMVNGDLNVSDGSLVVGTAGTVGSLDVTGNYNQSGGSLNIDITDGDNSPSHRDTLIIAGSFALTGTTTLVANTPGYTPDDGDVADVATYAGSATGTYTTFTDDLTGSDTWTLDYGTSPLRLEADVAAAPTTTTTAAPTTTTTTTTAPPSAPTPQDPMTNNTGYWMVGVDGNVYPFGDADDFGSPAELEDLNAPTVGISPTPSGSGYFVVAADGGVFAYGDARFQGSAAALPLNDEIVGIASNPVGDGYWLVGADGGVFAYGDAGFYGSAGNIALNQPVLKLVPTPTGNGYWLVAADGGVFAYGDAGFYGSAGNIALNEPILSITASSTGHGYWLVASDGGVFAYGDAAFLGSAALIPLQAPIVNIRSLGDGSGYWLIAADGGVFAYGNAKFFGTPGEDLTSFIIN